MKKALETIGTQSFIEKVLLLLATAALSGFLIPVVTENIEHNRLKEQRIFEAELARQNEVIKAQVQLLETLASLLWEYQLLAIDVSYYQPLKDQSTYLNAVKKYDEESGPVLGKIRAEISKSLRLTSHETYEQLKDMYYSKIIGVDVRLRSLIEGHKLDWASFNRYTVYELSEEVDNVLNDLAIEVNLKSDHLNETK